MSPHPHCKTILRIFCERVNQSIIASGSTFHDEGLHFNFATCCFMHQYSLSLAKPNHFPPFHWFPVPGTAGQDFHLLLPATGRGESGGGIFSILPLFSSHQGFTHRRRITTEAKAKVVACVWGGRIY